MKRFIAFKYVIALIFSGLFFVVVSGCGDGDSGPAPVMHTVASDSSVSSNMFGLALEGTNVWVAYQNTDSGNTIRLYRSSDTGITFTQVFDTDVFSNGIVRIAVDSADKLYLFYREFNSGHHIAVSTMYDASDVASTAVDATVIALSGASFTLNCLDVSTFGTTIFFPYTGGDTVTANYLIPDFTTGSVIQTLESSINDGGIAGYMKSATTWMSAYVDETSSGNNIRFALTENAGTDWTEKMIDDTDGENVDIAATGDNIVVSYYNGASDEKKVYVIRSTDNGANWSSPVEVASAYDDMTSLAVSTGYFNLVFTKNNGTEVCLARSSDNGETWKVKSMVRNIESSGQKFSEIQASGDTIGIAFRSDTGIYFFRSTDDGATWD